MLWIKNPARLKAEVAELEALRDREPWLLSIKPTLQKNLNFAVEFVIELNGVSSPFTLEYPAFFPDTPPIVTPHNDQRISDHQYGPGGELCLEYRADNWDTAITGAMMVASTYRLLSGERSSGEERAEVPSAHRSTIGQRLRGTRNRFLLTAGLRQYAAGLTVGTYRFSCIADVLGPKGTWMVHVRSVGVPEDPEWGEDTIPVCPALEATALLVRVASLPKRRFNSQESLDELIQAIRGSHDLETYDSLTTRYTILADGKSACLYYSFLRDSTWYLIPYHTIDFTTDTGARLPQHYTKLNDKKVGIVGCGSLGSKIATSLARSGIFNFVLVDDDILKPGNLVRHDLDAISLGAHKVDALEARLKSVSPHVNVNVRRVILGGQEAAGTTESVLTELSACDLLIDATADPQAFNFVAAAARSALRPMIWAEVYAGGIGGFVARVRPGFEPPPNQARQQYLLWCEAQGIPWTKKGQDYEVRSAEIPLIADDADVSIIAAHVTRMAIDQLLRPEASAFPHPAYCIGLSEAWLFSQPFDVRPVDFTAEGEWGVPYDEAAASSAIDYLTQLLGFENSENRTGT